MEKAPPGLGEALVDLGPEIVAAGTRGTRPTVRARGPGPPAPGRARRDAPPPPRWHAGGARTGTPARGSIRRRGPAPPRGRAPGPGGPGTRRTPGSSDPAGPPVPPTSVRRWRICSRNDGFPPDWECQRVRSSAATFVPGPFRRTNSATSPALRGRTTTASAPPARSIDSRIAQRGTGEGGERKAGRHDPDGVLRELRDHVAQRLQGGVVRQVEVLEDQQGRRSPTDLQEPARQLGIEPRAAVPGPFDRAGERLEHMVVQGPRVPALRRDRESPEPPRGPERRWGEGDRRASPGRFLRLRGRLLDARQRLPEEEERRGVLQGAGPGHQDLEPLRPDLPDDPVDQGGLADPSLPLDDREAASSEPDGVAAAAERVHRLRAAHERPLGPGGPGHSSRLMGRATYIRFARPARGRTALGPPRPGPCGPGSRARRGSRPRTARWGGRRGRSHS